MKFLRSLLPILMLIQSCSKKDNPVPTPQPISHPDTLSAGWTKIKIDTANFSDIFFVDVNTGYLAGDQGIFKSNNGGVSWQKISVIETANNIAATADGKLFAISYFDSLIRSFDGGASFDLVKLNNTPNRLYDLYFTGNDTGYLPVTNSIILRTIDGGHNWSTVSTVAGLSLGGNLRCIPFFLNDATGWISDGSNVFRSNGSIHSWTKAVFDNQPNQGIITVHAASADVVYAASAETAGVNFYKSTNGGLNFTRLKQFASIAYVYPDIFFTGSNTGYIVTGKRLYKTLDGGTSWNAVVSLGDDSIVEIHFTDAHHGWACGTNGTVLIYNN